MHLSTSTGLILLSSLISVIAAAPNSNQDSNGRFHRARRQLQESESSGHGIPYATGSPSVVSTTASSTSSGAPTKSSTACSNPGGQVDYIGIALGSKLDYDFVKDTEYAIKETFYYMPKGLEHGLNLCPEAIDMKVIRPYSVDAQKNGYTTAVVILGLPHSIMDSVWQGLCNKGSLMYNDPKPAPTSDLSNTLEFMNVIDTTYLTIINDFDKWEVTPNDICSRLGTPGNKPPPGSAGP